MAERGGELIADIILFVSGVLAFFSFMGLFYVGGAYCYIATIIVWIFFIIELIDFFKKDKRRERKNALHKKRKKKSKQKYK